MAIAYQQNSVLSIIHRPSRLRARSSHTKPFVAVANTILAANCSVYTQGDLGLFRISHGRGNDVNSHSRKDTQYPNAGRSKQAQSHWTSIRRVPCRLSLSITSWLPSTTTHPSKGDLAWCLINRRRARLISFVLLDLAQPERNT